MNKIKLKKHVFTDFICAWCVAIVTILLYYPPNITSIENIVVACISSMFSSIVLVYILYSIEKYKIKSRLSFGYVLLAITGLYNQNSLTKYVVDSLFDGYISNLYLRLLGSIFVDFIIILTTYIIGKKYSKKGLDRAKGATIINIHWVLVILLIGFLVAVEYIVISLPTIPRTIATFVQFLRCIVYSMAIVYAKSNEKRSVIIKYGPIGVLAIWYLYLTAVTGTKSLIVLFAFIVAISLYYLNMISIRPLKYGFILSPFIIRGISTISEIFSGRMNDFSNEWVLRYHSFRYDLSDFAMTNLCNPSSIKYSGGIISDALKFAIPSGIFSGDKDTLLKNGAYREQLRYIGLQPYDAFGVPEDFNDTLFSIGAQIGGFIGMILLFVLIVMLFDFFSKKIIETKNGFMIAVVMIGMVALVECDMFTLINSIRDIILVYIVVIVFYRLISVFMKKRKLELRK